MEHNLSAIGSAFGQRCLPLDLALAKHFAWLLRSNVRGQKTSLEPADEAFAQWWLIKGRSEYSWIKIARSNPLAH